MVKSGNIKALLLNELKFEFKSKQSIGSIFLYVLSSTFLAYLSFKMINSPKVWNGVFWIILLFSAINSTMNSFKESQGQHAYLHSLVDPREIMISKILYNAITLLVVSLLCLLSYTLFLGSYISDIWSVWCVILLPVKLSWSMFESFWRNYSDGSVVSRFDWSYRSFDRASIL